MNIIVEPATHSLFNAEETILALKVGAYIEVSGNQLFDIDNRSHPRGRPAPPARCISAQPAALSPRRASPAASTRRAASAGRPPAPACSRPARGTSPSHRIASPAQRFNKQHVSRAPSTRSQPTTSPSEPASRPGGNLSRSHTENNTQHEARAAGGRRDRRVGGGRGAHAGAGSFAAAQSRVGCQLARTSSAALSRDQLTARPRRTCRE